MYRLEDKMCELMAEEEDALQVVSRFGLGVGVGDASIADVCAQAHVHAGTVLAVLNYKLHHQLAEQTDIDLDTLRMYLRNAHTYFIDFRLPRVRSTLVDAIYAAEATATNSQIPMLILRCYDEWAQEIRAHIERENEGQVEAHAHDEQTYTGKLKEIKRLIIKYFPTQPDDVKQTYALLQVLSDIWHTEQDFAQHCAIEEEILAPAMQREAEQNNHESEEAGPEELSDREKDVLRELAGGLSNKEIADRLCISTHTVITHRKNIARKLNIHSTAGLTIYSIVNKIVSIDNPDKQN